ncbi:hypothetical protein BaRGS_00008363, partial [Batillaria attramentaria]
LLPEETIADLAALLNNDADNDEEDVCLQTLDASSLDLLSASVLSFIEDSTDGTETNLFSCLEDQTVLSDAMSVAASTSSGYSSGCESCISNDDAVRAIQQRSSMSKEEQHQVISEFTQVISSQLGMRERLEAIHIINPHAKISPTDTECYIDMAPINDSRFSSLQRFVRLHTGDTLKPCTTGSTETHGQRRQEKNTSPSAYASDHLVMCAKSKGR